MGKEDMSVRSRFLQSPTAWINLDLIGAAYTLTRLPTSSLGRSGATLSNPFLGGVPLMGICTGCAQLSLRNVLFVPLNAADQATVTIDVPTSVKGEIRWINLLTHGVLTLNAWENGLTPGVSHLIAGEPSNESALTQEAYKVDPNKPWQFEAMKKLEYVAALPKGWDSYGGERLLPAVRDLAVKLIDWIEMDDLPVPAIVLCSAGTVQFEWKHQGRELEIEVVSHDSVGYLIVHPSGEIQEGVITHDFPDQVRQLIAWLLRGTPLPELACNDGTMVTDGVREAAG
jgi:hypothetical protein